MAQVPGPLGVFVIGALGDVATCAAVGAAAIGRGLAPATGLVTALADFQGAGLAPLAALRFGGVDVRSGSIVENARALAARESGLLPAEIVAAVEPELEAASRRIGPGFVQGAAAPVLELAAPDVKAASAARSGREAVAEVRGRIRAFKAALGAERAVVVHLASTERRDAEAEALEDDATVERRLDDRTTPLPASVLYAVAAIDEGCPYVNFTPCAGATAPALRARAAAAGIPIAGRDGKTGETLLKSVLAPLFAARNLRVLSWAGYNILGNRDGRALTDPGAKAAKLASKGSTLGAILSPTGLGSEHVAIEYVPSIGDWKTAWDHVHFEGFLGTRMSLELTWRGADSALAAPLVLDLVRLIDRAARAGRRGPVPELCAFFKDPIATEERAFPAQMDLLRALAQELTMAQDRAVCPT